MIVIRKDLCPQNHPCPTIKVCPVGAISQVGNAAPTVDNDKCIACCKCTKRCSVFTPVGCCGTGEDKRFA
jgi:ferredoxin